jgi:hypothetical protein
LGPTPCSTSRHQLPVIRGGNLAHGTDLVVTDDFVFGEPTTIAVVPEPETYAMLLAGLGLLGFITRRKKRNV